MKVHPECIGTAKDYNIKFVVSFQRLLDCFRIEQVVLYNKNPGKYILKKTDVTVKDAAFVKGVYSFCLKSSGTSIIVDKYPEMLFRTEYLCTIFKNPKFIFLTRNAADTIESTKTWSDDHRDKHGSEDWWGVSNRKWQLLMNELVPQDDYLRDHFSLISQITGEADKAAVEWIVSMNRGLKEMLRFPDKFLRVRYEDLCNQPESELLKICDFLEIKTDSELIDFGKKVMRPTSPSKIPLVHPLLREVIEDLSVKLGYLQREEVITVTE
jgi:hypothetical protein